MKGRISKGYMEEKLRIAYCEDEKVQIDYMNHLIQTWEVNSGVKCIFTSYESAKTFLFEHQDRYPFDVVVLDIDMQEINGMELAKRIREVDSKVPIVFLTNRKEYVFEGYEVNAFRYILKPIDLDKLTIVLNEICRQLYSKKCYIIEKQDGEIIKIDLEELLYIEVTGHYLNAVTLSNVYRIKKSLQEIAAIIEKHKDSLQNAGFIYTHRSYLANIKYIERILKTECIMSNQASIPISRNCYKSVNDAFIKYYK